MDPRLCLGGLAIGLLTGAAQAAPIIAQGVGIASPTTVITFSEPSSGPPAIAAPVGGQFAGVGASFAAMLYDSFGGPGVLDIVVNFGGDYLFNAPVPSGPAGPLSTYSILFAGPVNAASFSAVFFASLNGGEVVTFTSLLGAAQVEQFSAPAAGDFNTTTNIYGFQSSLFDSIRIDLDYTAAGGATPGSAIDNLAFTVTGAPELDPLGGSAPLALLAGGVLLWEKRWRLPVLPR